VTTATRRVLVIGMDGATLDLVRPWAADGHLPNLAKLMANGAWGPLASTLQPATAPAWTTFLTGVNQGKHGLYDFVQRRAGAHAVEVTNASHVGAPNIFEMLSQAGLRVSSVNVPYTFPPRPVNGIVVGGPFAPAVTADLVYPTVFFETLKSLVPDYFVLPSYDPQAADPLAAFADTLLQDVAQRERISRHLLEAETWDLSMVVFMATDEVQHSFWHCLQAPEADPLSRYRDVIRKVYARIDQAIGALVAAAARAGEAEPTVIVLSDHGFGPFRAMINLNHWLAQAGLFHFQAGRASRLQRLRSAAVRRTAYLYRRHVPAGLREKLRNRLGVRRFSSLKGEFESILATSAVDWSRTQAYSLGVGGNIFVNLKGREPDGIVEPGLEYERVRTTVIEGLAKLTDPETGQNIVRQVHRREDLYHGPFLEKAPDLVIEWVDYAYWGRANYDQPDLPIVEAQRHFDFSDQPLSGSHRPNGMLIAAGPGIRAAGEISGARLVDMAPTIMKLLNVAPPEALDGRILLQMLAETEAAETVAIIESAEGLAGPASDYTEAEAEKILEHLRSLGYL
jgi:predicted AlkP superfamily phosphohydrolase/phosphomutase